MSKKVVTPTTIYVASDGTRHDTEQEAHDHNAGITLTETVTEILANRGYTHLDIENGEELAMFLIGNPRICEAILLYHTRDKDGSK
jgi:hypothetical protein